MSERAAGARRTWVERAEALVSTQRLRELAVAVTAIPSPTGDEAAVAGYAAEVLAAAGAQGRVQHLDERQANATGRLRGDGTGADLLLYAPLDTLTTGTLADVPVVGPRLRPDMLASPVVHGDRVVGLGAGNPKGHAACVLAAAEALAAADVPWTGDVMVGLGAGGMPTNGPLGLPDPRAGTAEDQQGPDRRRHVGHGVGCSFLLEQGAWPDFAVVAKPGWTVSWEEVGLAWFEVTVRGTHTYVGSRHTLPYRNAVAAAGRVAQHLEGWFETWTAAHTDGLVRPQGVVGAVAGGWLRMPAVTPDACVLRVDLRLSPRTTPAQAHRELRATLAQLAREEDLDVGCELVLAVPGGSTDPGCWVARSARTAWEELVGRPHTDVLGMSGATDANILRGRGVPTVRVGMPKPTDPDRPDVPLDFAAGMNTVDVRAMEVLVRHLIRVAVDTCTRPRSEVLA